MEKKKKKIIRQTDRQNFILFSQTNDISGMTKYTCIYMAAEVASYSGFHFKFRVEKEKKKEKKMIIRRNRK